MATSGRLHSIDTFLGINDRRRRRPEETTGSSSPASSAQKFTKYIHGLDLLAHELYHPKNFLLAVKQEYLEWIEQATDELQQKTTEKAQRHKEILQHLTEQHLHPLAASSLVSEPSPTHLPHRAHQPPHPVHPAHPPHPPNHPPHLDTAPPTHASLFTPSVSARYHTLSKQHLNNYYQTNTPKLHPNNHVRPPKPRSKSRTAGPPASLTQRRLGKGKYRKWKQKKRAIHMQRPPTNTTVTTSGARSSTTPTLATDPYPTNHRFDSVTTTKDNISALPKKDYVWEVMSVMPSRADTNSVALQEEYKFSEEKNAWTRIVFPSKRPTDKRNALELEKWLTKNIHQVEQTIASKCSTAPNQQHWVPSVDIQMSTELPVLSTAVKELDRQLQACHDLTQQSTRHMPSWTMAASSSNDNTVVLKSLWRSTMVLMGDIVEWAKLQQGEKEFEYQAHSETIKTTKTAISESIERLKTAKYKYQQTCGKTDIMRRIEQKRLKQRANLLREYMTVGQEVSLLQQRVQDLLRDAFVSKKLALRKIHMFLSTVEMMIDQMNECIDNEPAHVFLFNNNQLTVMNEDKDDEADKASRDMDQKNGKKVGTSGKSTIKSKGGADAGKNSQNEDKTSSGSLNDAHNDDDEEENVEENDDDNDTDESDLNSDSEIDSIDDDHFDNDRNEKELAELNKPVIAITGSDLERLSKLQVKILELRHLIARLSSNKCFVLHAHAETQTDDMMLSLLKPNEEDEENGAPAEIPPAVLAHGVFLQLYKLWRTHGVKPMHVFGKLDDDGSGYVDEKEFRIGLSRHFNIELTQAQVNGVYGILDSDGSGSIEHKEFSRAVKKAGKKGSASEFNPLLVNENDALKKPVQSYHIPPCFKHLLNAVPSNYSPMAVTLSVAHRLIWKIFGYATKRLNSRDGIRLPELIIDYFILTFHEPHAAQVRIVDFLTALYKQEKEMKKMSHNKKSNKTHKRRNSSKSIKAAHTQTEYSIRIETFLRLLKKCDEAAIEAESEAANHGANENYEIRAKSTDDVKQFVSVLCQLMKQTGSMHSFVEDHNTGLHYVGSDIARKLLRDLPSYRMGEDTIKGMINDDLNQHSKMMAQSEESEQLEMIDVDDVLRLAMSLWYEERKRAQKMLEVMFVDGDEDGDGYLTLDEFRNMIQKVDSKRSGVEVTHMYREAMALTSKGPNGGGGSGGGGGITPDAFAVVGLRHGLLVQPIQRVEAPMEIELEEVGEVKED
jgi:Ca2+-binding EF-hand superfamily protein